MNAEQFLTHYERIAEAPDAISHLRQLTLNLAIRGTLLDQDPKDEPASLLLTQVAEKKSAIVRAGKFKTFDGVLDRSLSCFPFVIPRGWSWCYLEDIAAIARGGSPRPIQAFLTKDPSGIPWIKIGDSTRGSIYIDSTEERIKAEGLHKSRLVIPGDLLLSNSMSFGFPYITNVEGCIHDGWLVIRTPEGLVNKLYLHKVFLSDYAKSAFASAAAGAVVQNLNADKVRQLAVPLPPLAEQHRIVAKVDELMALCDRLEAARAQREATRDRLTASTLARLNTPEPPASPDGDASKETSFQSDARFALNVLPVLTTRPDQIQQLRQAIRNLAVRGKLAPQVMADGAATTTLSVVASEIPKPKVTPLLSGEQPYDLPANWQWIRFGTVIEHSDAGWSPKAENHPRTGTQWGVLKVSAVSWGQFRPNENKQVLPSTEPRDQAVVRKGDFLLSRANTAELVARAVVVEDDPVNLMLSDKIVRLTLTRYCDKAFLLLVNNYADHAREHYAKRASGVSPSMKNISRDVIYELPIPFPPLAEQHRIVAIVDELMSMCDQLEATLTRGENIRSRLLNALLHETLQPGHENVIDFEAARQRLLEKRQAVACRIVERLSRTVGFGRVRAVKPLYFAEAHCGVALGGRWGRGDFGPYDHWIRSFESQAVAAGWLTFVEHQTPDGSTRVEYTPGPQLPSKAQAAAQVLGDGAAEFERVLTLLAGLDTSESEIVATLYAAWNDLLLEKKSTSDDLVISEFREHWGVARKADFDTPRLQKWLDWMRKNQLTPKGQGPSTRHQAELI